MTSDFAGELCGQTGVAARQQIAQARLVVGRQVQPVDEAAHRLGSDALAAGQRLELLVRVGQAVAAHHRLHGFGQHFPGSIEIGGQALGIDAELAQTALQRIECDQRVAERGAQRAQYGGVGQVTLPAADRQLGGEMFEQRIGDAEVAFGVLEVDRVDLVRHRRAADFASLSACLK